MSENRNRESPEMSRASASLAEMRASLRTLMRHAQETAETGKHLWEDPEVRTGAEATLRSVINICITLIDTVPGAGELVSWGADIASIIEEVRFRQRKHEATLLGQDPDAVRREKYNLTPDVPVWVKTVTEVLEIIPAPLPAMLPTHGIETTFQLWYDVPRMYRALKKARAILIATREQRARARDAANAFLSESPSPIHRES